MVALAFLRGRDSHPLPHDFRSDRGQFAPLRGYVAVYGRVQRRRRRGASVLAQPFIVLLTVIPVLLILIFTDPVNMLRIGGIAQAMMLPVIGLGVVYHRHSHLPKDIQPSQWVTVGLWVSGHHVDRVADGLFSY